MKALAATLAIFVMASILCAGDEPKTDPPEPQVSFVLGPGQGGATPTRLGSARTGAGNVMVSQPAPDTLSVKMIGAAAAKGHPCKDSSGNLAFELDQSFEVVFHSSRVKSAKLVMWSRAVGLLRSECHCCDKGGSAEVANPGHASVNCGPRPLLTIDLPPRSVAAGQNLSICDREGPVNVTVAAGKYTLHQRFGISAVHGRAVFSKPTSAEFAPESALDEAWLGKREPFHGADKKDFGFHVILKVVADDESNERKEPTR